MIYIGIVIGTVGIFGFVVMFADWIVSNQHQTFVDYTLECLVAGWKICKRLW